MKTFNEFMTEMKHGRSKKDVNGWVVDKFENTDWDVDKMAAEFVKHFGKKPDMKKAYDAAVSAYLD